MRIETTTNKFDETKFLECKFVKEDKNGTKTYEVIGKCDFCGGKGIIPYYSHHDSGVCYTCMGTGKKHYTYLVRTEEYASKLEEKRNAKAREEAKARKEKGVKEIMNSMEKRMSFITNCKNGSCANCKHASYCSLLNDFIDNYTNKTIDTLKYCPNGCIEYLDELSETKEYKDNLAKIVAIKEQALNKKKAQAKSTNYLGNVGDKIEFVVKDISKLYTSSVNIGYGRELQSITYKIVTNDNNVVLWTTGTCLDDTIIGKSIKGTIKELKEYKGEKETVITRGKVGE